MQKYFLVVFNEDYADEHNVPAQACYTENQYNLWLKRKMGSLNKTYIKDLEEFKISLKKQEEYIKAYLKIPHGDTKAIEALGPRPPYVEGYYDKPKKSSSYLHARLGNSGDGFSDRYDDYLTGEDFVKDKTVQVYEVSKEFFEVFNQVRLYDLSLCNIFSDDIGKHEQQEEEDIRKWESIAEEHYKTMFSEE